MQRASEPPQRATVRDAILPAAGAALWLGALLVWQLAPALDARALALFRTARGSAAAQAALTITFFGNYGLLILPTLVGAAILVRRGERRAAIWLAAVTLVGRGLTEIEKALLLRARPPLAGRLVETSSMSFPSAHAFNSMLVALALVIAFRGGRPVIAAAITFSLAVGISRLMLGVHWPSDVVAGWGSAVAWALALRPLLRESRRPG